MVRLDHVDRVARLTIARGSSSNAFDLAGWRSLFAAIRAVRPDTLAVLLDAEGDCFSAGADIAEIAACRLEPEWPARFLGDMRRAIDALGDLPMPVIAIVDGGCFGAAVALALAADVRIAGSRARFAITPARLGMLYPAVDVRRLAEVVGSGQARRLLLSADTIDAQEALRIGLVEQYAESAGVAAHALAQRIAGNAPGAIRGLKAVMRDPGADGHDAAFLAALTGHELEQGLERFLGRKRMP